MSATRKVTELETMNIVYTIPEKRINVWSADKTSILKLEDVILSPVSMASTKNSKKLPSMHGIDAINNFAATITKDHHSTMENNQSTSFGPPPLIPLKKGLTVRIKNRQSLLRKSVETSTQKKSTSTSTPPGINLMAISNHHPNPSRVYRKPVTTKETASIVKSIDSNIIDLTVTSPTSDEYSIIPLPDIVEKTIYHQNIEETSIQTTVNYKIKRSNKLINGTDFRLTSKTKYELNKHFKQLSRRSAKEHLQRMKDNQLALCEWKKVNPGESLLIVEKAENMTEIISTCQDVKKRNRTKSAYYNDNMEIPLKSSRNDSNESLEIINLDELPEESEKNDTTQPIRTYRTATHHDSLFNMIKSDATKVLEEHKLKKKPDILNIPSGSKNIQISNGQLCDVTGSIRLLDKAPKQIITPGAIQIARIHHQNAAVASLPNKDKIRKLAESMKTNETVLNWLENGDEKNVSIQTVERVKRTYSRSKSVSAKSQMRFKINNLSRPGKLKKIIRRQPNEPININHDQDWQTLTNVLSTNVIKSETNSSGINTPQSNIDSRSTSPTLIENILNWNKTRTYGQLPKTPVIFQRNEFDMIELDGLAMTKIKALRSHKSDYKNFPQVEPSMACGHSDFAGCFDSVVQRINSTNPSINFRINGKKPHQFYSTEFKEIIGALVQRKNNNCQAIHNTDVITALMETNMYDRTKDSSHFSWSRFIDYFNSKCTEENQIQLAPTNNFVNLMPKTPNTFEIGQKLEAIDPQNSSLFCICSIVEKSGYRLKLRFDGYPAIYDFWVNADSNNIFPAGWCSKTGRELEVHRRFSSNRNFDWKEYLRQTNTQPAHRACFPHLNTARTQMNPFKIGMKLEADDIRNTKRIHVATIGDVIDSRVLVTLDGFDSTYNYWADIRSPYIHPINFHEEFGYSIISPPHWRMSKFSWDSYLRVNRAEAVPKGAFHTREPMGFTIGMALEVVDKKNPSLIRPAVVTMIDEYQIKVLFIGWPERYAYWIEDDSCDIFPPGYCKKTNHPIECPLDDFIYELPRNSCGTPGCRGIGNGKRSDYHIHGTLADCPYEKANWSSDENSTRPPRVDCKHKLNNTFNIGAGPSRKVSVNPAFEKVQVSIQPTLNPAELAAMSSKDVEIFRRLQVSTNFILGNRKILSEIRDQWIDRIKPLRPVQLLSSAKNPLNWNTEEVANFISQLPNCSMIGATFIEHDIDGIALLSLQQNDMIDIMGLSVGSAIKIFNRIVLLREECNAHYIRYE